MNYNYSELHVCKQTYGKMLRGGGGLQSVFFFFKILMVSDKTIHKAYRIKKTINKTHQRNFLFSLFTQTILWLSIHLKGKFSSGTEGALASNFDYDFE